ncbi:hypothetical protein M3Y94_00410700 [Aphelenchoides besseyi]|nr:hypothetical protein M3Y94_00410700 [Aphelenchoides besseyi]
MFMFAISGSTDRFSRLSLNIARQLLLLLCVQLVRTWALKCFSGNPAFKNECTSLSHCLMIISRNGRVQHSCDGNSYQQVSLCSTLGLQQDVDEEANANYPSLTLQKSASRLSVGSDPLVRTPYDSSSSSNRYYPPSSRTQPTYRSRDATARRYTPVAEDGLRCFDAGLLGKICCCTSNFCNSADSPVLQNHGLLSIGMLFLLWRLIGLF